MDALDLLIDGQLRRFSDPNDDGEIDVQRLGRLPIPAGYRSPDVTVAPPYTGPWNRPGEVADKAYAEIVAKNPRVGQQIDLIEGKMGPLPATVRHSTAADLNNGLPLGEAVKNVSRIRAASSGGPPAGPLIVLPSAVGRRPLPFASRAAGDPLDALIDRAAAPAPAGIDMVIDAGIQRLAAPDFSDVTGSASSKADDLLRKKRQQIADAWKAAAHNAPNEGLGGVPVPDTSPSAVLASTVDLAGATAANANVAAANLPRTVLTGMEEMVNRAAKPFREASGQDQREAAAREWLAQRFSDHPLMPLEATLAGNQLGPQSRVPDPLGPVQEMTQRAQDAATVRLAEASTNLPVPLAATAFWGGTTAGMLADASQYVGGRIGEPFGSGPGALPAAAAREAALSAADMAPEEAAYLARRAEALRSMPGATEAPLRPGAVADAMQPERSILQVGEHADRAAQDAALGLRAAPEDAPELARTALALDEHAPPSLPRQEPPSLAEIFFGEHQPPEAPPRTLDEHLPLAGPVVDGRAVRAEIPNQDSIASSLDDYEVLPGVREVPMSHFDPEYQPAPYSASERQHLRELTGQIAANKEINPLIVVYDAEKHPYILEGGHRFDALKTMGAKSLPAQVVIDTGSTTAEDVARGLAGRFPAEAPPLAAESAPIPRNLLTREELPLDTPYTGTKNAITQSERIARGLPEVEDLARKSTGDTWHEARTLFEHDPEAPRVLAQQVAEKPRVLTPVENDLLLHDRMKMTLDHREALAAESAALDAGDADAAAMAKLRRTSIEAAMDTNDTALKRAGGEWGSAGAARQKLISEDYSPLYLRQRLAVASREAGVPPSPGAVEKLDQLSAQLTDAQQQLAAYESRVSELEAQRNVAAAQRETVRAQRAGVRAATRQQLDQEYEQLGALLDKKARARQSTTFMSGGLDPETVAIITKMARNRVQAGVTALPDLVQGIHQTIAPHIPGLEPSEVRDAISGYGVVRNQATRSEAEAALARIRQQGRLVSKIEALQEGEALPAAAARAKPDEVTLALREKLRQTVKDLGAAKTKPEADRLAAIQKRLEQRIADAERGIGNARAAKVKDTPQIKALRQQLQQTLEEHGLAPEGGGRQLTDEQRLAALKTRLAKREAELTDAIATGSIPKKIRRPLALDADAVALQGRVNNLKRQADLIIRKQELAGRGPLEKGLDWTAGWGRFLKLTGTNTLAKISAAAAERALVFKPVEEVLGAAWSKVPVVRDVAARAPIEGGGSLDAIAKSYAGFFGKQAREEMGAYLRGGEGNLEAALGKPHLGGEAPAWMSYPGKVHAALKSPAKVAAYEYAMEKQAKFYLGKGNPEALLDPALQAEMKARAWEYAKRDIFMGDNAAVSAFRRAFAHQEGESLAARAGKTTANVLMPIVKVPTNYALEATDYLFGVPKGIGRLAFAVKKGISELPAEQADLIMRQLKKGSLGAAMIGLGAAGVVEGGGYWQAGEHRKESDLQPGEVKVAGITIPHLFLHHPVVEALQVGANLRRAKTLGAGAWTSAKGLAEQVPFIETPVQMSRDLWGRTPMKAVGEVERGMTIPPDAQRLARVLDQKSPRTPGEMTAEQFGLAGLGVGEHRIPEIKAKKRTPHGSFLDQLYGQELLGIPGLRDNVR